MSSLKIFGIGIASGTVAIIVLAALYLITTSNPLGSQILQVITAAVALTIITPVLIVIAKALSK